MNLGSARPGVCGRCGKAVVRSRETPDPNRHDEINGHVYNAGRLVRVRCKEHGGIGFEDEPDDPFGMPKAGPVEYGKD